MEKNKTMVNITQEGNDQIAMRKGKPRRGPELIPIFPEMERDTFAQGLDQEALSKNKWIIAYKLNDETTWRLGTLHKNLITDPEQSIYGYPFDKFELSYKVKDIKYSIRVLEYGKYKNQN